MSITNLLSLMKLLDGGVYTLLENGDLLILLLSQAIHVSRSIVQLDKEVVDLKLFGLCDISVSVRRPYMGGVLDLPLASPLAPATAGCTWT